MDVSEHYMTPSGKLRARALGIPFDGSAGLNNAITDVQGVEVGYCTLISGEGPLVVGQGPVRTGVTAILPRGKDNAVIPVFSGCFSLNGYGEMTGFSWIEETGRCEGPITITNTHSCGIARDASIRWMMQRHGESFKDQFLLPVAAETYDGFLNDINGFHVKEDHVIFAIESATHGQLEEGSIGGGTGMRCYEYKGGTGTASRVIQYQGTPFTVGAFVQANFGRKEQLLIAGVPVGKEIAGAGKLDKDEGSIIGILATDAPLLPRQLKRLAYRAALGMGRSGAISGAGSGDLFLAFSTANAQACSGKKGASKCDFIPDDELDTFFEAVILSTDEAIINSMIANKPMVGRDNHCVDALPHDQLIDVLKRHNRLRSKPFSSL